MLTFNQWFPCVNRKKSLQGIKRKLNSDAEEDSEVEDPGLQDGQKAAVESDDEAEYYRQAVGEEPDEGELKRILVFKAAVHTVRFCCDKLTYQVFCFFFPQTCFLLLRRGKAQKSHMDL